MADDIALLEQERSGDEGTFTFKMRFMREWDRELFDQLIRAMHRVAQANAGQQNLEKHLVYAFYFFSTFIPQWSSHPAFPKSEDQEYYSYAFTILDNLCVYLFKDQDAYCVYDRGFDEALLRLNDL